MVKKKFRTSNSVTSKLATSFRVVYTKKGLLLGSLLWGASPPTTDGTSLNLLDT